VTPPAVQRISSGALVAPRHHPALPSRHARPNYGVPVAPRRVSGPVRHPRAAAATRRRRSHLLDQPLLDRLIRGRIWIALVAVGLLGIVALRVAILSVGTNIGDTVARIEALQQSNEQTATRIATIESGGSVSSEAGSLDMVEPPAANVVYLRYGSGDGALAADSIVAPLNSPLGNSTALAADMTTTAPYTLANTTAATDTTGPSTTSAAAAPSSTSAGPSSTATSPAAAPTTTTAPRPTSTTTTTAPVSTQSPKTSTSGGGSVAPGGAGAPGGAVGSGGGTSASPAG
jgi:hypothetical protein